LADNRDSDFVSRLCKMPAWVATLTEEHRATIMGRLLEELANSEGSRDLCRCTHAIAELQRLDLDQARLVMEARKRDGPEEGTGEQLLAALKEAERRGGDVAG